MCGLFGLISYGKKVKDIDDIVKHLAYESSARGPDATGYAYVSNKRLHICKKDVSAYKLKYKVPTDAVCVIGHTRHATQGDKKYMPNNHPFTGKAECSFALAHNGVIVNDDTLRKEYSLPETTIETDSYIAVQLLEYKKMLDFDGLKFMAENVQGSFSFSVIDQHNNLYLVKGDSPLSVLHFPSIGMYVYASTDTILWRALIETSLFDNIQKGEFENIPVEAGEILKIDRSGMVHRDTFNYTGYFGSRYDWRGYGGYIDYDEDFGTAYLEELKSVAGYYGYTPEDIEELYQSGFTPDEIEEVLCDNRMLHG